MKEKNATKIYEKQLKYANLFQFTLANASPVVSECRTMAPNCAGCIAAASSQSTLKIPSSNHAPSTSTAARSTPQVVTGQTTNSGQNVNLCAPPLVRSMTSSTMNIPKSHAALQKSESNSSTVEQTVASVAHRRHSIPTSVFIQQHEELNETFISPDLDDSTNTQILSNQEVDDIDANAEEIDPSTL